jgi:hypothetical protein
VSLSAEGKRGRGIWALRRRSMQLNFAVVLAVGSLCVSLLSVWHSVRTHKQLNTIKKLEAGRDLKLKKLYCERVKI